MINMVNGDKHGTCNYRSIVFNKVTANTQPLLGEVYIYIIDDDRVYQIRENEKINVDQASNLGVPTFR